jgi:hypothetical protein
VGTAGQHRLGCFCSRITESLGRGRRKMVHNMSVGEWKEKFSYSHVQIHI